MPKNDKNTVKRTIDLTRKPRVSAAQKARLNALAKKSDDLIDYTDAPHLADAIWMKAAQDLPNNKKQITLRIDADVLAYFKESGARYQSRMNAVLRAYVQAQK
jgi:uncharacterized protein (DUF4415 family)